MLLLFENIVHAYLKIVSVFQGAVAPNGKGVSEAAVFYVPTASPLFS